MNIHHLELFYYVARHRGISDAVRNMPYGIQQPAVSGQIAQLEEYLGTSLFHRRPFELTAAGGKLFKFIEPFFAGLEDIAAEVQGGTERQIRIGSSDIVFRDYMPELLQSVRKKHPQTRFVLREGYQPALEAMLQREEIDLAITVTERKAPAGMQSMELIKLPLILIVPEDCGYQTVEELFAQDRIEAPLIGFPANEVISRNFQQGLAKRGVEWFPSIEVSAISTVETYVANGFGFGLAVSIPKTKLSLKVRSFSLPDFPPVVIGAVWRGKPGILVKAMLDEIQARVEKLRRQ